MNTPLRKKRGNYKQRTIKKKYDLLMEFRQNKDQLSQAEFCKKNKIPESTFSGYIIKRNEIINDYEKGEFAHNKIRNGTGWYPNLEIALLLQLCEFRQERPGVTITDLILQQAGGRLLALLNEENDHGSVHDYGNAVSEGYIQRWKNRYNQQQEKLCGESASADMDSANTWIENQLPQIIKKFGIENIYRLDEFGLYYEQGVDTTITDRSQSEHGRKKSKKRVTVLAGSSSFGDQLPLLIIGKSANPLSFRKHSIKSFNYTNQINAWINSIIFNNFLIKGSNQQIKLKRIIAIVVDNCSAHAVNNDEYSNIKIFFIPPKTTAAIQPMDSGIIHSVKKRYKTIITQRLFEDALSNTPSTLDLYQACVLINRV
ncbi:MAG: putative CENP-b protein 1 [Streblomastix strix]|uniref:Putative CENP-b protein 1 n=1 Tax=Streblomastix strix TaxID=222440 RepID=A0A5J4WNB6_9EUKA|nr:MAG: putative CENP-b protein 1 [Streblomastix strix]